MTSKDEFIRIHAMYEDGSTELLERVIGIDIYKDGDRPAHFISRCGKVCEPRIPTSERSVFDPIEGEITKRGE